MMEEENRFNNKKVLVLGLAKSGLSVAKLLFNLGANVIVNDQQPIETNEPAKELQSLGIKVITGHHPVALLDHSFDFIVKNPGIPYSNVMLIKAKELGVPIYTEVEIATLLLKGSIAAITGSNGKTTTTTLVTMMLKEEFSNRKVEAVGNIGVPLSSLVENSTDSDIYVTELSSFQLMGIEQFHPKVACIVNIFSAHLDYHGTREEYVKAKLAITKNQTSTDYLIYNADFEELNDLVHEYSKAQLIPFSRMKSLEKGSYADENCIYYNNEVVMSKALIKVPGEQNVENILAAIAIAKMYHVSNQSIEKAVSNFYGVKHRTQYVAEKNQRKFYNDSKATNIVATQTALRSFKNDSIILIAGGLDRGNGFDELIPDLTNVCAIVAFGETKDKIMSSAKKANITNIEGVSCLKEAVKKAYFISKPGDIILFSPACASWDQYKNFEIRGEEFIEAVAELK